MSDDMKTAIVTGGSSGIGRAAAQRLHADGFHVTVIGRDETRLRETVDGRDRMDVLPADLSESAEARRIVDAVESRHGRLDVLVNAHGIIGPVKAIDDLDDDDWLTTIQTNLLGPVRTVSAAAAALERSGGAIVNVGSINALQGEPWVAPYGVTKAALVAFTQYAAIELAGRGIRVNAVLPGWVRTPMAAPFFDELGLTGKRISTNLLGRPAEPEEIAHVISFLASPGASFLSGEAIVADGGQRILLAPLRAADD